MADIELRGGAFTGDRRLDRVPRFDEQSRQYPIRALIRSTSKPRSYSWRGGPVTDQGREGACVGHGWTGELTARPRPVSVQSALPTAYAYELYHAIQHRDPWPGCALGPRCPIKPEPQRYDGTAVLDGAKELVDRGFLSEYRWAFGIDDVILTLGYKGPVVLGIPWFDSMYEAPEGRVTVGGRKVGGHCILARAVNVKRETVTLRNSWGLSWGIEGNAEITFSDLDTLLKIDGEACVPVHRAAKTTA